MSVMRLKTEHPVSQKLKKIFDLMDELGVRIVVTNNGTFVYNEEQTYNLFDNDFRSYPMNEMPPYMEYKITYEKDL
jgi:translation elongation factor P/translation initiation factor 5A